MFTKKGEGILCIFSILSYYPVVADVSSATTGSILNGLSIRSGWSNRGDWIFVTDLSWVYPWGGMGGLVAGLGCLTCGVGLSYLCGGFLLLLSWICLRWVALFSYIGITFVLA